MQYIKLNDLCNIERVKYFNDGLNNNFQLNDICMNSIGNIGKCVIITDENINLLFSKNVIRLTNFNNIINHKYLYHILSSNSYYEQIKILTIGNVMLKLDLINLRELEIPVPTLEQQERIINLIENNRRLIDELNINNIENLINNIENLL